MVFIGITRFNLVLLGFIEVCFFVLLLLLVSIGFTWFYLVLLGFIEVYLFFLVLLGLTKLCCLFTGFYWVSLRFTCFFF